MSNPSAPIVAICIPSGDMVHADFAANLAALCLDPGARTGVINCKSSLVAVARNQCVAAALHINATHVLFLDSDMVFPLDTLKRLLKHEKDIVGALYSRRRPPFDPTGLPFDGASGSRRFAAHENSADRLYADQYARVRKAAEALVQRSR